MPAAKVGVVSTAGCPYCKKAKDALSKQGVEYAEAQLGGARDILAQVKQTTGQGTVPQARFRMSRPWYTLPIYRPRLT